MTYPAGPLERDLLRDVQSQLDRWRSECLGRPEVERNKLLLLALEREQIVAVAYREEAVAGRVEPRMLNDFLSGISQGGERLKAEKARVLSANNSNSLVELEMAEGKNREVRRLFESQGLTVNRLLRTQIGKIKLGELPSGKWRTLTDAEIKSLISG